MPHRHGRALLYHVSNSPKPTASLLRFVADASSAGRKDAVVTTAAERLVELGLLTAIPGALGCD